MKQFFYHDRSGFLAHAVTARRALCCMMLALWACKHDGHSTGLEHSGSADGPISAEQIQELGRSCKPDARARLVIAAASGTRDQRCDAMKLLARRGPEGFSLNTAFLSSAASALDQPGPSSALRSMLHDETTTCVLKRHDATVEATPRQVALWVLTDVPVTALRSSIEALPAGDDRNSAIRSYEYARSNPSPPAAMYLDSLTADASPAGFQRLLAFVASGFTWPTSTPPPKSNELGAVHVRVIAALQWLDFLASQHPDDPEASLVCVQEIKQAIRSGSLGEDLLAKLDGLDADFRFNIMGVFRDEARPGTRARLEQIASKDPDKQVRSAAETALTFFDQGGFSSQPRAPGTVPKPAP